jgi:hypothetical protein
MAVRIDSPNLVEFPGHDIDVLEWKKGALHPL